MESDLCQKESSSDEDDLFFDNAPGDELQIPFCIRYPGWTNFALVVLYGVFGIVFLTLQQGWHPLTALYVVVQIVTTIGYGDITVTTEEKVFMTFYVLLGTVLVAKIINDVGEEVLESASVRVDANLHRVEKYLSSSMEHGHCSAAMHKLIAASLILLFFILLWVSFFAFYEDCSCSYGYTHVEGCVEEKCEETGGSTKSLIDATYMAVITFSTVGFGDYTADTLLGRFFASVFMCLGVVAFFNLVAAVADIISELQRFYKNQLRLSRESFQQIDRDGSGRINKTEFQIYMMLRQGRITTTQLRRLDAIFDCMDRDGSGKLSYEEISNGLLDIDLD